MSLLDRRIRIEVGEDPALQKVVAEQPARPLAIGGTDFRRKRHSAIAADGPGVEVPGENGAVRQILLQLEQPGSGCARVVEAQRRQSVLDVVASGARTREFGNQAGIVERLDAGKQIEAGVCDPRVAEVQAGQSPHAEQRGQAGVGDARTGQRQPRQVGERLQASHHVVGHRLRWQIQQLQIRERSQPLDVSAPKLEWSNRVRLDFDSLDMNFAFGQLSNALEWSLRILSEPNLTSRERKNPFGDQSIDALLSLDGRRRSGRAAVRALRGR